MKIEIKHRFSGEVLFSLETDSFKKCVEAAVKANANLRGADLRGADLSGADLVGADLRDADLRGADLRGVNLRGADLRDADLRGVNLRGADLSGADLRDADLSGADLRDALWGDFKAGPEEIKRLDAVREIVLTSPERLDMGLWHGDKWTPEHTPDEEHSCGTAHCLAGWLQALSPDKDIRAMEPQEAGRKLAPVASGLFFAHKNVVMDFLKERWYARETSR